MTIIYTNN